MRYVCARVCRYVLAWNNLGDACEKARDLERAARAYEEALRCVLRASLTRTRLHTSPLLTPRAKMLALESSESTPPRATHAAAVAHGVARAPPNGMASRNERQVRAGERGGAGAAGARAPAADDVRGNPRGKPPLSSLLGFMDKP